MRSKSMQTYYFLKMSTGSEIFITPFLVNLNKLDPILAATFLNFFLYSAKLALIHINPPFLHLANSFTKKCSLIILNLN